MRRARYAPLLLLLALIPAAYGFTYQSQAFNYVTPSGGTLRYGLDYTAMSWGIAATRFTWGTVVYGGAAIGTVGFDPFTGVVMTVTGMAAQQLNYTVVSVGAHTQRIYYRGLGAPATTAGGTSATAGTITTVTTNGNTNVVLTWGVAPGAAADDALDASMDMMIQLFPLVVLIVFLEFRYEGFIGNKALFWGLLIAAVGVLVWMIRAAGY